MKQQFYNEDCISGAQKHLKDNSVDLIISDPPYGIQGDTLHKHYNRNESTVLDGYVEIPEGEYPEFSRKWIQQAERVLKPGGSAYIVSGYSNLRHVLNALAETDLTMVNHIIWKYNFGVYTSRKYISSHYHILYCVKPGGRSTFHTYALYADTEKDANGRSLNYADREDVWSIPREYKPGKIKNKNELPKILLTKMIVYSSNPNDLVCDFFLGSFSTAKVAIGLKRRACGFEISKTAFKYQMKEMQLVKKGALLDSLRVPPPNRMVNRGKPIQSDEAEKMHDQYKKMIDSGKTKKAAIENLSKMFGRGYWSILRIVNEISVEREKNMSLF